LGGFQFRLLFWDVRLFASLSPFRLLFSCFLASRRDFCLSPWFFCHFEQEVDSHAVFLTRSSFLHFLVLALPLLISFAFPSVRFVSLSRFFPSLLRLLGTDLLFPFVVPFFLLFFC